MEVFGFGPGLPGRAGRWHMDCRRMAKPAPQKTSGAVHIGCNIGINTHIVAKKIFTFCPASDRKRLNNLRITSGMIALRGDHAIRHCWIVR
jgi:hypothetical protein